VPVFDTEVGRTYRHPRKFERNRCLSEVPETCAVLAGDICVMRSPSTIGDGREYRVRKPPENDAAKHFYYCTFGGVSSGFLFHPTPFASRRAIDHAAHISADAIYWLARFVFHVLIDKDTASGAFKTPSMCDGIPRRNQCRVGVYIGPWCAPALHI
jgi:hypothetical protein